MQSYDILWLLGIHNTITNCTEQCKMQNIGEKNYYDYFIKAPDDADLIPIPMESRL